LHQLRQYIFFIILFFASCYSLFAQEVDATAVRPDSAVIPQDTIPVQPDSLQQVMPADTVRQSAGLQAPSGTSSLKEGVVYFESKDSLIFNFEGDRIATLHGSAEVLNESGKLESGDVELNLDKHIVSAFTNTPEDTLTQPVLTREGEEPLRSKSISFNYETEKGRFEVARITIPKGKITGTVVKKAAPHVIFIKDAIFSTCTLPHPHYYIKASKAKVVDEEEVFFEHARLYILDIPYPLIFPFGYLPKNLKQKQSGLLQPSYVYQNVGTRGIGLRNVGWFQYFNDYIVGQASVDIFTSGTFYVNASTDYRVRDSFNGGVQIGYSFERGLESTDPDYSETVQKMLKINHSQDFSPYSSMSANITLRTADFYQRNSYDIDDRVETTTSSNISYRHRHPENLYNFNASIRQSQNFLNNTTNLNGPSFNFNLKRISPFVDENNREGERKWYENISFKYDNSFKSVFRYQPIRADSAQIGWVEALFHPDKYRKATGNDNHIRFGFQQNLTASSGNIWPGRFINLTANADYSEFWVPATTRKSFNADSNKVITRKVRGFTAAREYSTSLNMSTTIYGISNTSIGNITGFRHTIRPTVSFSYRPDFSSESFGYFRTVQVDTTGRTQRYSIFNNAVFSGPRGGEQRAINFGISNSLEAKVVKRDSTGEKDEHILRIIDQLNLSSGYNFAADSLKLRNLDVSFTSSVIEGVNIRASANFNFYDRNEQGTKIDKLLIRNGGFMELVNFSLSASTRFSGGKNGIKREKEPYFPRHYDPLNQSIFNRMDPRFNTMPVEPFNSPWSLSLNFSYRWNFRPNRKASKSATLNARNIQFQLTPKWDFSTQLGYDFIQKEFTPSKFRLTRKLHMWNLSFEMSPFGEFQYYFFKLSINSSALQSIFQKLPLLNNLERSSSPTGAGIGRYR